MRCWHGIYEGLRKSDLWGVFDRHVFRINYVLSHMRDKGVLLDPKARLMAERKVQGLLDESDACIQKAVPTEVKPLKVYKKEPKNLLGPIEEVPAKVVKKICPHCGRWDVTAAHFKSVGKKKLKAGVGENACVGLKPLKKEVDGMVWGLREPFKISNTSLQRYQEVLKHKPVFHQKEKNPDGTRKVTFNVTAIQSLERRYPEDQLYKVIADFSEAAQTVIYIYWEDQSHHRVRFEGGCRWRLMGESGQPSATTPRR